MHKQLLLTREEIIQMIEHSLDQLLDIELVDMVNQYSGSWVRLTGLKENVFEWTGGEYPSYLASVVALKQATLDKDQKFVHIPDEEQEESKEREKSED